LIFRSCLDLKAEIREDGTIKLPEEFLSALGWTPKTVVQIEFEQEGKCLIITAPFDYCCICGTSENPFFNVMGKHVCEDCQQMIASVKIDKSKILNGQINDNLDYTNEE
jgi:hypothetical protein